MSENFNKSGSNPNSGPGFSAWDDLRTQYEDREREKAEKLAKEAREKALAKGGADFDKRMNTLVSRGKKETYEDYVDLHTKLHEYENNPSQEFTQEGEYKFAISDDTYADTVKYNPYAKKLNAMAKRIASLPEGEAKQKYVDQFTALSAEYARNEDINIMAPLDPSNENGRYKDVKHDFLDRAWAVSYGESISEAEESSEASKSDSATFKLDINPTAKEAVKPVEEAKNAEVKKEYTEEQKEGLIELAKLRLEFAAEGKDMDFAKAREFYDRYHQIAYVSDLSDHAGTITGFKPFMDKYRELSGQSKGQGFEEVEDQAAKSPEEAKKAPETEKSKEKKESRWKKLGKAVAGLAIFATLAGVFGRSHNQQEEVKPEGQKTTLVAKPAAESGKEGADSNGEEKDGGFEKEVKGPEAREKLRDNGKYDKAADTYFAQHPNIEGLFTPEEVKESRESFGLDSSNKTDEEYIRDIYSEDSTAALQGILMSNPEILEALGLTYEQTEALFDNYRNGDQAAYDQLSDIKSKITNMEVIGTGTLEGATFASFYLKDVNGDGAELDLAMQKGLQIGGKTRIIKFKIGDKEFRAETRNECGDQIVIRLSTGETIVVPPTVVEITETEPPYVPPTVVEKETPPEKEETPPKTPPIIPPYTPPYTPPIAPPPGVPEDFKFDTDQTIYGYGGSVMKEERGDLTEELTVEEKRDQATFDVTHMLEDDKVESEDNDSEESHSDTISNPIVSEGDTTDEARRIIEETQKQIQAEEEAKRREAEQQNNSSTIDGETLTQEELDRIQGNR